MTVEQARVVALQLIGEIAPEADIQSIRPDKRFRDQFDFDSVDFLNFALGLQERLGIPIPERDYPELATLNGCVAYLTSRSA